MKDCDNREWGEKWLVSVSDSTKNIERCVGCELIIGEVNGIHHDAVW